MRLASSDLSNPCSKSRYQKWSRQDRWAMGTRSDMAASQRLPFPVLPDRAQWLIESGEDGGEDLHMRKRRRFCTSIPDRTTLRQNRFASLQASASQHYLQTSH